MVRKKKKRRRWWKQMRAQVDVWRSSHAVFLLYQMTCFAFLWKASGSMSWDIRRHGSSRVERDVPTRVWRIRQARHTRFDAARETAWRAEPVEKAPVDTEISLAGSLVRHLTFSKRRNDWIEYREQTKGTLGTASPFQSKTTQHRVPKRMFYIFLSALT